MSYNKIPKFVFVLIALLIGVNVLLVLLFPTKPPRVLSVDFSKSPIEPQIYVNFSEPIDHQSILDGGLIFTPAVDGDISWTGNTLVYTPKENFEFGANYQLELNTTIKDLGGEYLKEVFEVQIETNDLSLLYLTEEGQIFDYNLREDGTEQVTEEGLVVEQYDYDSFSGNIVMLAREADEKVASLYLWDSEDGSSVKIGKASDADYQIHFAKWLPYENAVLFSRSKIDLVSPEGEVQTLSNLPEDTELMRYDFDTRDLTQVRTGSTLLFEFYPTPDGLSIGFINEIGALVIKNLANGLETVLASQFIDYFGFSEYGSYVIYTTTEDMSIFTIKNEIVLQDEDGEKKIVALDEVDAVVGAPTISPDEKSLAFKFRRDFENFDLVIADLESEDLTFLTEGASIDEPKFAPNGEYIAFMERAVGGGFVVRFYDFVEKNFLETGIEGHELEWRY